MGCRRSAGTRDVGLNENDRTILCCRIVESERFRRAYEIQNISERTFGFTLATVTAYGAKLDASDASINKVSLSESTLCCFAN